LDDVSRTVTTIASRRPDWEAGRDSALPAEVDRLFDERVGALTALETISGLIDAAFRENTSGSTTFMETLTSIRTAMRPDRQAVSALGVTTLLRRLIASFRTAVDDWFRFAPSPPHRLPATDLRQLEQLCQNYDAIFEYLPTFELESLVKLAHLEQRETVITRLRNVKALCETLAVDIRRATISLFPR
jgi:hypothetical protein